MKQQGAKAKPNETAISKPQQESQPLSKSDGLSKRIAEYAYELYVQHGCRDGYALDDWLQAEREILRSTGIEVRSSYGEG